MAVFTLCLGLSVVLTVLTPVRYTASVEVFVSTQQTSNVTDLAQGGTFLQARVQSYTKVATSPRVTEPVVRNLRLPYSASQLSSQITANAALNTVLIDIHVTDSSKSRVASVANAVAAQFANVVEEIESGQSVASTPSPVKLTVIQPATTPRTPSAPRPLINIGVGFLLGLILGALTSIVRELLDNTIAGAEQLAVESKSPTLSVIPWDKRAKELSVVFRGDEHGQRAEAYRQLRTNLQFLSVDNRPRIIAVTSAVAAEGKSTTAINLSAALAETGNRVVLVEADLRRPTVATLLGLVPEVGLTTVLIGAMKVEDALQNAGANLAVLTSGPTPPNPAEMLVSEHFRETLTSIADQVDYVIVDTAPLLPVTDGVEVAAISDAVILTVRARRTTRDQIRRAIEALRKVDVVLDGTVLSMVETTKRSGYENYYYYGSDFTVGGHGADAIAGQSVERPRHSPT